MTTRQRGASTLERVERVRRLHYITLQHIKKHTKKSNTKDTTRLRQMHIVTYRILRLYKYLLMSNVYSPVRPFNSNLLPRRLVDQHCLVNRLRKIYLFYILFALSNFILCCIKSNIQFKVGTKFY